MQYCAVIPHLRTKSAVSLRFTVGLSREKYKETARNLGVKSNHVRRNREGSQ